MMIEKTESKTTWPIGAFLIVSVCGAIVMSMPGLDLVPASHLLIQAAVFLVLMWGRLAWALLKHEDRGSSRLYIALMIILPFVVRPLGDVLLTVYDLCTR